MSWPDSFPIDRMPLSIRTVNVLKNADVFTFSDLVKKTDAEIVRLPNAGAKTVRDIKAAIAAGKPSDYDEVASLKLEVALWRGRYEGAIAAIEKMRMAVEADE
jgi:DNA-directed RNA polymerase alpha subunit